MRLMDKVKVSPSVQHPHAHDGWRRFLLLAEFAIAFSPDREPHKGVPWPAASAEVPGNDLADFQQELCRTFYERFYVDRAERAHVIQYLEAARPVVVHGLAGVGKTIVLAKTADEFGVDSPTPFVYLDLKQHTTGVVEAAEHLVTQSLALRVYNRLLRDFVQAHGVAKTDEWWHYAVANDEGPEYTAFRDWLTRNRVSLCPADRPHDEFDPISSLDDWQSALAREYAAEKYSSIVATPHLETLIRFLTRDYKLALCFDNVDRYPLDIQSHVLEFAIDLSNSAGIPVVIAIRECNLRRATRAGDKGDFCFEEALEQDPGLANVLEVSPASPSSIEELLQRRMDFIRNWPETRKVIEAIRSEHPTTLTYEQFDAAFWACFRAVGGTFVDIGLHEHCNGNVREILLSYLRLISKAILHPTDDTGLKDVLRTLHSTPDITKLRNYLYRWLICGDALLPAPVGGYANILDDSTLSPRLLALRVLEYLQYRERRSRRDPATFGQAHRHFQHWGVSWPTIGDCVLQLTRNHGAEEYGFLWLSRFKDEPISEETVIRLLPAGRYFLRTLACSREYAFWAAMTTRFPVDLLDDQQIPSERLVQDEFKLRVVLQLAEKVLVPEFEKELAEVCGTPEFTKVHLVEGIGYPQRLLESARKTIHFAAFPRGEEERLIDELTKRYSELIDRVDAITEAVR